jgi:hypothetical protein
LVQRLISEESPKWLIPSAQVAARINDRSLTKKRPFGTPNLLLTIAWQSLAGAARDRGRFGAWRFTSPAVEEQRGLAENVVNGTANYRMHNFRRTCRP